MHHNMIIAPSKTDQCCDKILLVFVPFLFACLVTLHQIVYVCALLYYTVRGGLLHIYVLCKNFHYSTAYICIYCIPCISAYCILAIILLHKYHYFAAYICMYCIYLHVLHTLLICILHSATCFACLALSCAAQTPLCLLCYALYKLYMHILYLYMYLCTYSIRCNVIYIAF